MMPTDLSTIQPSTFFTTKLNHLPLCSTLLGWPIIYDEGICMHQTGNTLCFSLPLSCFHVRSSVHIRTCTFVCACAQTSTHTRNTDTHTHTHALFPFDKLNADAVSLTLHFSSVSLGSDIKRSYRVLRANDSLSCPLFIAHRLLGAVGTKHS